MGDQDGFRLIAQKINAIGGDAVHIGKTVIEFVNSDWAALALVVGLVGGDFRHFRRTGGFGSTARQQADRNGYGTDNE